MRALPLQELERLAQVYSSRGRVAPQEISDALKAAREKAAEAEEKRVSSWVMFQEATKAWEPPKTAVMGKAVDKEANQETVRRAHEARRRHEGEVLRNTPTVPRIQFHVTPRGVAVPCDDCGLHAFARDLKRMKVTRRVPDAGWEGEWKQARMDRRWEDLDKIPSHLVTLFWDMCPLCVIKHSTKAGQLLLIPDSLIPSLQRYGSSSGTPQHGGIGGNAFWRAKPDRRGAAEIDPSGLKAREKSYRRFIRNGRIP